MVKKYKTASGRIEETKYNKWVAKCVEKNISPNEDILRHIDEVLKDEPRETGTVRETSATNERQTPTVDGASEEKPNNRTIIVNGKTYTY